MLQITNQKCSIAVLRTAYGVAAANSTPAAGFAAFEWFAPQPSQITAQQVHSSLLVKHNYQGKSGYSSQATGQGALANGSSAGAAVDTSNAADHESKAQLADDQDPTGMASAARAADAVPDDESVCHPADPYCQAGEQPPRPDDFHEEGDGTTPPSSGFPA